MNRRDQLRRLAVEDSRVLQRLTLEKRSGNSKDVLHADRLRYAVIDAVDAFGLHGQSLPRGYKMLGNVHTGGKTAHYLRKNDSDVTDEIIVADALDGFIEELNAKLGGILDQAKPRPVLPTK